MEHLNIQNQWIAEALSIQKSRELAGGKAGIIKLEHIEGRTGLEVIQGMLTGTLPFGYIGDTLDFSLIHAELGTVTFQSTPQLKHFNPMGGVHGGWYATLLDSALGCAVHTMMPIGRGYTTAELSVNIVRGANTATGPLRVIGKVLHCGKQLATAQASIVDSDGKLYAHGTTTCLVFSTQK